MKFHIPLSLISFICFHLLVYTEDDGTALEQLCYSINGRAERANERKSCACNEDSSPPWGLQTLRIDCSFRNLQTNDFASTELLLPFKSETLDFSWNKLEKIPLFASETLKQFNLMHNNLSKILDKNFVKLVNLEELYLRWNGIQMISGNSFAGLQNLRILDLAHNNLKDLSGGAFAELLSLETLLLSWNRYLNQAAEKTKTPTFEIYSEYGINSKLKILNLEMCGLQKLNISHEGIALTRLNLRNNRFKSVPAISANNLKELDLSENPIRLLMRNETEQLPRTLTELLIEDMPEMEIIDAEAFVPLTMLKTLSVQNSRNLIHFHELAFGLPSVMTMTSANTLQSLNLRGTGLRKINSTLLRIFSQLDELHLNGNPLNCDCELLWLKQLTFLDANVKCYKPNHLRGMSVKNIPDSEFVCEKSWPHWVQNGVIFLFIVSFAVLIVTVGVMLRPQRGQVMTRRRVGAGSPYARITIEPNRSENNF